jgi:FkbM family methyltransferase
MKQIVVFFSGIFPVSLWEKLEYASAYFAGKGSGSSTIEAEVNAAMECLGEKRDLVILDVGANQGDWTAEILRRADGRVEHVYQFEPSPHNVKLLKERFRGDRVTVEPSAVGDREHQAKLFSDVEGSGVASLYHRRMNHFHVSLDQQVDIRVTTLDDFIAVHEIEKIDFMKMDIEGAEFAALQGAEYSLRRGIISAFSFEFGGGNIDSRTYFQDFWYFLIPFGFRIFRILPNGSLWRIKKYSEMLEAFRTTNYIAMLAQPHHEENITP